MQCILAMLVLTCTGIAQDPTYSWAKTFAGDSDVYGDKITYDSLGNMYVFGHFDGTVDFDPGAGVYNLTATDTLNLFILKLSPSGSLVWVREFGGPDDDRVRAMTFDNDGDLYLMGTFRQNADLDPGPGVSTFTSNGANDGFLIKLDTSGTLQWAKTFGGTSIDGPFGIDTDISGNVYICGQFYGSIDLDPGSGTASFSSSGSSDAYLFKLDEQGDFQWGKTIGGSSHDLYRRINIDPFGNILLSGEVQSSSIDFDPGATADIRTTFGERDMFMQKLDSTGAHQWVALVGGAGYDVIASMDVDLYGNLYTTGVFSGTVDLDPDTTVQSFTSIGSNDMCIHKLRPDGTLAWVKQVGGDENESMHSLITTQSGGVLLSGHFSSIIDFDPGPGVDTVSGFFADAFLLQLSANGDYEWVKTVKGIGLSQALDVAIDAQGNYLVTGIYSNSADFDPGPGTDVRTTPDIFDFYLYVQRFEGCRSFSAFDVIQACDAYTWINDSTYNMSTSDTITYALQGGCDSTLVLQVTITETPDTAVIEYEDHFVAADSTADLYWIRCDSSYLPIAGADSATYYPTVTGLYALVVSNGDCSDTSDCYSMVITPPDTSTNTGIQEWRSRFRAYPNPTTHDIWLEADESMIQAQIVIHTLDGRLVRRVPWTGSERKQIILPKSAGIYQISILQKDRPTEHIRIVKTK